MNTYFDHVRHVLLDQYGAATSDGRTIRLIFWNPIDRQARWPVFTSSVPTEPTAEQLAAFEQSVAEAKRYIAQLR